eukprot:5887599-Alexandrium_andersonii.AAC.1
MSASESLGKRSGGPTVGTEKDCKHFRSQRASQKSNGRTRATTPPPQPWIWTRSTAACVKEWGAPRP